MKTLLVPTDFSKNATQALHYAAGLASQVRGKLIIMHIINLPIVPIESSVVFRPDPALEQDYKKKLDKIAKKLQGENGFLFEVETVCRYGYLLVSLNELVSAKAADLVVMGTYGANNLVDKLVGTFTAEFIKQARCPVLVIPAKAKYTGINRIVYASDFEKKESIFMRQLSKFTEALEAKISIVNVQTKCQKDNVSDEQLRRKVTRYFPATNYGIVQVQYNNVVEGLRKFLQENKADVLAIAIQEHSFLEELFYKSVSTELIYHPTLPLLALPQKPYQKLLKPRVKGSNQTSKPTQ